VKCCRLVLSIVLCKSVHQLISSPPLLLMGYELSFVFQFLGFNVSRAWAASKNPLCHLHPALHATGYSKAAGGIEKDGRLAHRSNINPSCFEDLPSPSPSSNFVSPFRLTAKKAIVTSLTTITTKTKGL
jgi:hypothetical protein